MPIDVGRIFFVGGGSEAIESALKIARQYHRLRGEPTRYKFITRRSAYHGTTMGALSINGSPALRTQFEPLLPGCLRAPMPYRYRCPYCSEKPECTLRCADEIDAIVVNEGPQTVAAVILEPVQNSAGSITPPPGYFERVREICDEHGLLLVADEVICGFGRVGDWFGSTRYGIKPDMMALAKGITPRTRRSAPWSPRPRSSSRSSPSRRPRSSTGSRSAAIRSRARSASPTWRCSSGRTSSSAPTGSARSCARAASS